MYQGFVTCWSAVAPLGPSSRAREVGLDEDEEADLDGSTGAAGGLDDIARDVLADNDGPALRARPSYSGSREWCFR